MKVFFYMGRNPANRSGVSWKIWKVTRKGQSVTTIWGPAVLKNRKVVSVYKAKKTRFLSSPKKAIAYEATLIRAKLAKGYERRTRWRSVEGKGP